MINFCQLSFTSSLKMLEDFLEDSQNSTFPCKSNEKTLMLVENLSAFFTEQTGFAMKSQGCKNRSSCRSCVLLTFFLEFFNF